MNELNNETQETTSTRKVRILTEMEEIQLLPEATLRRVNFLKLIEQYVKNANLLTSNCIILEGNPGTGKTTLITQSLESLKKANVIYDYYRVTGHITKTYLYSFLEPKPEANGKMEIHVFDDADLLGDSGCLELLKSAYETRNLSLKVRSHDFRRVSYNTKNSATGYVYNGYGIIITNQAPEVSNNIHYKALLDRSNKLKVEFGDDDLFVFNASVIQKELDENLLGWSDESIEQIAEFFQSKIRNWWNRKAFQKAQVNFSLRLIHRFMDNIITFGPDFWKQYSEEYQKLEEVK